MNKTEYDVGWNDMAYGINTWDGDSASRIEYVQRCRRIAADGCGEYKGGARAACDLFLKGGVEQLAYRGGWKPAV